MSNLGRLWRSGLWRNVGGVERNIGGGEEVTGYNHKLGGNMPRNSAAIPDMLVGNVRNRYGDGLMTAIPRHWVVASC